MMWRVVVVCMAVLLAGCAAEAPIETVESSVPQNVLPFLERSLGPPSLEIVQPVDGAVVQGSFDLRVDVRNVELSAVGRVRDGKVHVHVATNGACLAAGELIPHSAEYLHASNGEPQLRVDLEPGTYELCAQLGDGFHVAMNVVDRVVVEVRE